MCRLTKCWAPRSMLDKSKAAPPPNAAKTLSLLNAAKKPLLNSDDASNYSDCVLRTTFKQTVYKELDKPIFTVCLCYTAFTSRICGQCRI